MTLFSNRSALLNNYFSYLLAFLPVSFIAGNLIINLNIVILIISAIFLFGKDIFSSKYYFLDKILVSFFFLILITGFYNDVLIGIDYRDFSDSRGYFYTTIKSILFLKYLLMYLIIKFLIEKEIINLKFFFISSTFASIFVCSDVVFQFISGRDIFGFEADMSTRKLGGPFGDELIAGSYIQRFSLFTFFTLPLFFKNDLKKFSYFFIPILLIIILTGLILSGNRMPIILFLFILSLIVIFNKQTRKFILPFLLLISLIFFLSFKFNENVKNNFINFYKQVSSMTEVLKSYISDQSDPLQIESFKYYKEFQSFYGPWSSNKLIGGGIKNFRFYCHNEDYEINKTGFVCNMHPHNYYLEILTETGLIGFLIISIVFLQTLYYSFFKKYFTTSNIHINNLIIPFIFLFIAEIFPIKSTGSFFTTGNATYLFLILPIIIGLVRKDISIEKKI